MMFNWYRTEQDTHQHEKDTLQWAQHERLVHEVGTSRRNQPTISHHSEIVRRSGAFLITLWTSLFRS